MKKKKQKVYRIKFYSTMPNWVSVSTIEKRTMDEFIRYLYSLDRNIVVLPYISGGGGAQGNPTTDRTCIPKSIAEGIRKKEDIDTLLNKYISWGEEGEKFRKIHFMEDVYEFYLSLGIENLDAYTAAIEQYNRVKIEEHLLIGEFRNNTELREFAKWIGYWQENQHYPYHSRWVFVYMFRNEFKRFMETKGYRVEVDGGWVLNNKHREVKLGLINKDGELY